MADIYTKGRGLKLIAFGFRHAAGADPDFIWDANSGEVVSIDKDATTGGTYTVTLAKPYPRQIVAAFVQLHDATGTLTTFRARVDVDSYSDTAGTFDIETVHDNDGDGDLEILQPTDNAVVSVLLVVQMVEALASQDGEAHS